MRSGISARFRTIPVSVFHHSIEPRPHRLGQEINHQPSPWFLYGDGRAILLRISCLETFRYCPSKTCSSSLRFTRNRSTKVERHISWCPWYMVYNIDWPPRGNAISKDGDGASASEVWCKARSGLHAIVDKANLRTLVMLSAFASRKRSVLLNWWT